MVSAFTFWFFLGISWAFMINVGVILVRRNNQLLKRNADLELALFNIQLKDEMLKSGLFTHDSILKTQTGE